MHAEACRRHSQPRSAYTSGFPLCFTLVFRPKELSAKTPSWARWKGAYYLRLFSYSVMFTCGQGGSPQCLGNFLNYAPISHQSQSHLVLSTLPFHGFPTIESIRDSTSYSRNQDVLREDNECGRFQWRQGRLAPGASCATTPKAGRHYRQSSIHGLVWKVRYIKDPS